MKPRLVEIKAGIQSGDLQLAGQELLDFSKSNSSRFTNEIIGQLASLRQILTDERKGISSNENIQLQKNRITYAMLDLVDEISEELSTIENLNFPRKPYSQESDVIFEGQVGQVIIQQSNSGDILMENKEKVIKIGANAQISAPIIIADSIQNSFNMLAKSNVNDEIKTLLEQLIKSVTEINKQVPLEHTETAQLMVRETEDLVREATNAKPRRKWYEVSIEGLKQAALNIGEVATPVLEIVGKLAPLLISQ
jgi:hypothetical protein